MKISRKAVSIFLIASALFLTLLLVLLNALVDRNRDRLREEIQQTLGRPLTFDQLRLSFWGGPGLSVKHLRIAEDPRFAATPFIQTKELTMQLRWLPLLLGYVEIKKFVLEEPEIQIIRNESGGLNISALAGPQKTAQKSREAGEGQKRSAPSFVVSAIHVANGKIDYIDRSLKEPVEIRVHNVDMDLKGLSPTERTKVRLAAKLFEGQGQNITVEGWMGPFQGQKDWTEQSVDLQVHIGSLLLPQLTRAIPFLRDKFSLYLGVAGPLMLKGRLLGAIGRARISDLSLSGPFFGSTGNNATLKGEVDFSEGSSWRDAEIRGKIVVDPVNLSQLKKIALFREILPASLVAEGPASIAGELQGNSQGLRLHARVEAGEGEIQYGGWLKKGKGVPAQLEITVGYQKDRLVFEESTLSMHNLRLKFSGLIEESPERRLMLKLSSERVDLAGWDRLLLPLSAYSTAGSVRWDLSIEKKLALRDGGLEVRGTLNLDDTQAKDHKGVRSIDKMTARISFRGKEARIESGEGAWQEIPFRNLRGTLAWLPNGLSFKNLTFQALSGSFQASGALEKGADDSQRLVLDSNIETVDLKALLSWQFPKFKDHVEGRLSLKARLQGQSKNGSAIQQNLQGQGTVRVRGGALNDFNLVEGVLSRVTGLPGIPKLLSSRISQRYSALFKRRDTPFETLQGTFAVQQGRIHTDDLSLATPDYSINGKGWIGFDKAMKWNAELVMAPQFTQELMHEHKNVRYMVDGQGRLAVPFRLEGTLPHVQPKPDLQGLAEAIQRGLLRWGMERALREEKDGKKKERREWIQKGLEQLFGK